MGIHFQKPLPEIRAMFTKLPQFRQRLQRTAPAGNPAKDIVQSTPVEAAGIAIVEAVCFRHPPFHQRVVQVLTAVCFVRSNAHILYQMILPAQIPQVLVDDVGFQTPGTPAAGMGRPAEAPVRDQLGVGVGCILVEVLLCCQRGFQTGNGPPDVAFQPGQVIIHLREFPACVTEQDLIDGSGFLQKSKKHRRRIFST